MVTAEHKPEDGTKTLASAIELQRLAKIFKWMPHEEAAIRQVERMQQEWAGGEEKAMAALQAEFQSRAKNGSLTPTEALIGQYCLFCLDSRYARFMLMSLFLRVPPGQRIPVHNWAIAQDMPRATKEAYGDAICNLTTPLYPHCAALEAINTRLLQGRKQVEPDVEGGGWIPVIQDETGRYGVSLDVSMMENEIKDLRQQLTNVREANMNYRGRGGGYRYRNSRGYDRGGRGYDRGGYDRGLRGGGDNHDILDGLFNMNPVATTTPVHPPSQPTSTTTTAPPNAISPPTTTTKRGGQQQANRPPGF